VSESALHRLRRRFARPAKLPSERDWGRSDVLEARPVARHPELISDGGGLPFPPAALAGAPGELDPQDPAVVVLLAEIANAANPKRGLRKPDGPPQTQPGLEAWRLLARTDDEALFGRGNPPRLLTVAVRQDARRRTWKRTAISAARPLRATRDGIRASSWRLDPTQQPDPEATVLRVLVTEQTFSGAQYAHGRVLAPDLYFDGEQLLLTMFVTPRPGFQNRAPNPETPVRITLPNPLGQRQLVDGALYGATAPGGSATAPGGSPA
jgi:hypothetical protein